MTAEVTRALPVKNNDRRDCDRAGLLFVGVVNIDGAMRGLHAETRAACCNKQSAKTEIHKVIRWTDMAMKLAKRNATQLFILYAKCKCIRPGFQVCTGD
jgi:hypothetical protein